MPLNSHPKPWFLVWFVSISGITGFLQSTCAKKYTTTVQPQLFSWFSRCWFYRSWLGRTGTASLCGEFNCRDSCFWWETSSSLDAMESGTTKPIGKRDTILALKSVNQTRWKSWLGTLWPISRLLCIGTGGLTKKAQTAVSVPLKSLRWSNSVSWAPGNWRFQTAVAPLDKTSTFRQVAIKLLRCYGTSVNNQILLKVETWESRENHGNSNTESLTKIKKHVQVLGSSVENIWK